ncbi:hypothetical protein C4D60_Mb03t13830 [Musa balbisiana]|uniref:Uncharacterized protein n=1 Tax=Musa balbisiana TaxID=52838 RepID=A0A4S8JAV7_MUSBA|nr:hypothetical protein C4D60_Mb03t13830 [Musa balbisiana]
MIHSSFCGFRIGGWGMDMRSEARTPSGPVLDPSKLPKYGIEQENSLLQKESQWPPGWPVRRFPGPQVPELMLLFLIINALFIFNRLIFCQVVQHYILPVVFLINFIYLMKLGVSSRACCWNFCLSSVMGILIYPLRYILYILSDIEWK